MGLSPTRYGILPGAFNPPTEAHLALARAALTVVDHVIFVLPQNMPHKDYSGVPFATRFHLLQQAISGEPRFAAVQTAQGLFIEIARELRAFLPAGIDLRFLCGRDAAERIVDWDYGIPGAFDQMLQEFGLLVAPRHGHYEILDRHKSFIATIDLAPEYQVMSATSVRDNIRSGSEWEHLVPAGIRDQVRVLYKEPSTP